MYAITRLQYASGTWCWSVSFSRQGVLYQRSFFDPGLGGPAAALKAATAWRDEQLTSINPLSVAEFCQIQRGNNTSGVAGVHFLTSARQPQGIWQAKLKIKGKARHKSFSVLRHGWQAAYEMAVAARAQLLAEAKDSLYLHDKLAKKLAPKTPASDRFNA